MIFHSVHTKINFSFTSAKKFFFIMSILLLPFYVFPSPKMSSAQISELKINPAENEKLITNREIKFELDIPEINPATVEITTPQNTDEILFRTLRKTSNSSDGTKIELWYEFTKSGERKPESLSLKISNKNYKIPFEYVWIEENPINILPRMIYKFSNGKSISSLQKDFSSAIFSSPVSKTLKLTVYVQYTNEITNYHFEIPKDSLFQNTKNYKILENIGKKSGNNNTSADYIPVAEYEWTPLSKGRTPLPEINLQVVSIAGNKVEIKMPNAFVNVTSNQNGKGADNSSVFKNQFDEIPAEETVSNEPEQKKENLFIRLLKKIFNRKTAIYKGGQINDIPETTAGNHLQVSENTPVKILKETSDWYCIQVNGNVGWTKKENIEFDK